MSDTGYIEQNTGIIEGLKHNLDGIRNRGHVSRQPVPYLHKDDHNFGNLMDTIQSKIKEQRKTGAMRVGVIVGTGAMLSIAPNVDVDAWLVLDNNNFVLEWSEQTVQALRQQPNRHRYTSQIYSGVLAQEAKSNRIDPNEWLEIEKQALGRLHFLNSDSRFMQAKQQLTKTPVLFCQGDLSNQEYLEELAGVLRSHNAEIAFANLTDVLEFAPPLVMLLVYCHFEMMQ